MTPQEALKLFSGPFMSVSDYRYLIGAIEARQTTLNALRALNSIYPGLLTDPGKSRKILISTAMLLRLCPALQKRLRLNSAEFEMLEERIEKIEKEILTKD